MNMVLDEDDIRKLECMYARFIAHTSYTGDIKSFCEDYINRCECCEQLCYDDELEERTMWNGKVCQCCEECQHEVDSDKEGE